MANLQNNNITPDLQGPRHFLKNRHADHAKGANDIAKSEADEQFHANSCGRPSVAVSDGDTDGCKCDKASVNDNHRNPVTHMTDAPWVKKEIGARETNVSADLEFTAVSPVLGNQVSTSPPNSRITYIPPSFTINYTNAPHNPGPSSPLQSCESASNGRPPAPPASMHNEKPTPTPAVADPTSIKPLVTKARGPRVQWTAAEDEILVRTAEYRMCYEETMRLLPGKTLDAAKNRQHYLKILGKFPENVKARLPPPTLTPQSAINEILRCAREATKAEEIRKKVEAQEATARREEKLEKKRADTKARRQAAQPDNAISRVEKDPGAMTEAANAANPDAELDKRRSLNPNWEAHEDIAALRMYFERKDDNYIAQQFTDKNAFMVANRRKLLIHGDLRGGVSRPSPVYHRVLREYYNVPTKYLVPNAVRYNGNATLPDEYPGGLLKQWNNP